MPSLSRFPASSGATSVCAFVAALLYVAVVQATCGCFSCLSGMACTVSPTDDFPAHVLYETEAEAALAGGHDHGGEFPSADFRIGGRWDRTASSGSIGRVQGTPANLTWGIVRDGTSITGSREGTSPSDLVAMMDSLYGASATGDLQDAPWFRFFEESFDRWSELSGVTYTYEPNDLGAPIRNTSGSQTGVVGQYADSRIGGHFVGTSSTGGNILAYNYFPNHGDMVIDTDDASFFGNTFGDSRRLRNTIMHEAGHGLGFNHLESNNSAQLMEPFIQTSIDGPQIDDILAAHRNYGDFFEKAGGNDSFRRSEVLGAFGDGDTWAIGTDGNNRTVGRTDTDFISIDDNSDVDFFTFTVSEPSLIDIDLTQVGGAYSEGPQDGDQTTLDTSTLNRLELQLLRLDGSGVILEAEGERVEAQRLEFITEYVVLPGEEYFVRVSGTENNVQLYQLDLAFAALPIPEATGVVLLMTGLAGLMTGRRRTA